MNFPSMKMSATVKRTHARMEELVKMSLMERLSVTACLLLLEISAKQVNMYRGNRSVQEAKGDHSSWLQIPFLNIVMSNIKI